MHEQALSAPFLDAPRAQALLAEGVALRRNDIVAAFRRAALSPQREAMVRAVAPTLHTQILIDDHVGTLLHHASRMGAIGAVRVLLSLGAAPDDVDERGWLPVQVACAADHHVVFRTLLHAMPAFPKQMPAVYAQACASSDPRYLRLLLEHPYALDVSAWDVPDARGDYPLHRSCAAAALATAAVALSAGARWSHRDARGRTAADRYAAADRADPAAFLRDVVKDEQAARRFAAANRFAFQPAAARPVPALRRRNAVTA